MSKIDTFDVRVQAIVAEAEGINSIELHPLGAPALPPFGAGAHIDLYLANAMVRSYSLVNSQDERHRYVIAVNKDPASRGGSRFIHETLRVGETLKIGAPRNNFPLDEAAEHSVFIAGGIGVTPLLCMCQRMEDLGRSWELVYSARTRRNAAFLDRLEAFGASKVHLNFDREPGGTMLDLAGIVASKPSGTHFYCCGPIPMLAAFERATAEVSPDRVHLEYFSARDAPVTGGGFVVELARTQRSIAVAEGMTLLDALLQNGIDVPHSCREGVCGSCETTVLDGVPDHRDLVLSKEERARNRSMMVCCSGSKSERLVLDL